MSAVPVRWLFRVSIIVVSVAAGMAMAPPENAPHLEASGFDLVDERGTVLASLWNNRGLPELVFFDKKGDVVTAFRASPEEASISLGTGESPPVRLVAKDGMTELRLKGPTGEMRWSMSNEQTQWTIADSEGHVRIRIGTGAEQAADIRFIDPDGRPRMMLGLDESGRPRFQMRDEDGKVTRDLK